MVLAIREIPGGVEFPVKVVPGSSRDRVAGLLGDALKVAVSAPPEKGRANRAVAGVLAHCLAVKPAAVQIVSGRNRAHKMVRVTGLTAAQVSAAIRAALGSGP